MNQRFENKIETYFNGISENIIIEWQSIIDLVTRIAGTRVGLIMRICEEDIEPLIVSNTAGNPYHTGEKERLYNSGMYCEEVIRTQNKLLVSNALKSDEWNHNPDLKHNLISYLGFPIRIPDGKPFGTICLLDDKENQFSDDLIELMEKMRNMIEGNLKLEMDTVALSCSIEKREKTEAALRESELRLRTIMESAKDAIIIMDPIGQISYWNTSAEHVFGYSFHEVYGKPLHDLIAPQRYHEVQNNEFAKFIKTGQGNFIGSTVEFEAVHKNGHEISIELSLSSISMPDGWHAVGIVREITERKRMENEINYFATHDTLTGLLNKRSGITQLSQSLRAAKQHNEVIALLYFDLDGFKIVNDTFGHLAGDYVIQSVSRSVKSVIREKDVLVRFGGDEFFVIAGELNSSKDASVIARKIISVISTPILLGNGKEVHISASLGISFYPDHGDNVDQFIHLADEAMYAVKRTGRNNYSFAEP